MSQADSYDQVYDIETALDEAIRTALLTATELPVYTRKNAVSFQKERPRIGVETTLGGPTPQAHKHLIAATHEQHIDLFRFTVELTLITALNPDSETNILHPQLRARVRRYMAGIEKTLDDVALLPYHVVMRCWPQGSEPIFSSQENTETSKMRYEGDVFIRHDAWPDE